MKIVSLYNDKSMVFEKQGAFLALAYAFLFMLLTFLLLYSAKTFKIQNQLFCFIPDDYYRIKTYVLAVSLLELILLWIFLRIERQNLQSVGISSKNIVKSLLVGVIGVSPLIIPNMIVNGLHFKMSADKVFCELIYYIVCIGFTEEVVFRGYVQSRIEQLFKKKILSVFACGLLFAIFHLPNYLLNHVGILTIGIQIVIITIIHIYLLFLFKQSGNITGISVGHGLIDFIGC